MHNKESQLNIIPEQALGNQGEKRTLICMEYERFRNANERSSFPLPAAPDIFFPPNIDGLLRSLGYP